MIDKSPVKKTKSSDRDLTRVGFFEFYPQKNYTYWDRYMHEICGLPLDSEVNKNEYFVSIVHPEEREQTLNNIMRRHQPGDEINFDDKLRIIVDGQTLTVTIHGVIFRNENKEAIRIIGIITDITEARKTQKALSESEEKLRSILDYTQDNIFSVDRNFEITYINTPAPGLSREDVIGINVLQFVSPVDKEKVHEVLKKVFSEGTVEEFFTTYQGTGMEIHYMSKVTPIFNGGKVVGATFIARDVTEQENTRIQLAESEYRFRTLVESSTDNIFTIDREWRINFINRVAPGLKKEEVIGTKITDFLLPEDFERVTENLYKLFTENEAVEYNTLFKGPEGDVHYSTRVSPLSENGEVYGAVFISRDITTFVNQSEAMKEQQKELQRINQNLEQLAYVSSHDMKAPVANLKSLVLLLEEENAISESGMPIFDKMKMAIEQMNHTIVTLNEVFAVQSNLNLERELIDISKIYKDVYNSIENQIKDSNTRVTTQFELKELKFPTVHLISILQNLITNSIKYKHPERDPEIRIKTYKEEGFSWLEVSDNGRGIDLEKYGSKVFGLFQRFDLSTEGKGIGLHIIKSIVENYGGEVMLRSQPGDGSTFIIRLD